MKKEFFSPATLIVAIDAENNILVSPSKTGTPPGEEELPGSRI